MSIGTHINRTLKLLEIFKLVGRVEKLEKELAELKANYEPIKHCECCPAGGRQPLRFVDSTTTKKQYECPKTLKRYFFNV